MLLKSSDGVQFMVDRMSLCANSGVFRDMLSIPQPSSMNEDGREIPVTESWDVLDHFLKLLTGADCAPPATLDRLLAVALVSRKYDAPCVLRLLRADVHALAPQNPLHAYAIAARFDWENEAKYISTLTHTVDIHQMSNDDVAGMSALYLWRLVQLRHQRETKAREMVQTCLLSMIPGSYTTNAYNWWNAAKAQPWAWFQGKPPVLAIDPGRILKIKSSQKLDVDDQMTVLSALKLLQDGLRERLPNSI